MLRVIESAGAERVVAAHGYLLKMLIVGRACVEECVVPLQVAVGAW